MAKRAARKDAARTMAIAAARIAADSNCEDIAVLDVRDTSPITDYLVIATGTSDRQMRSAGDDIIEFGKANDNVVWQVAGMESGGWIVLDFVDVVVHLFDQKLRRYYDLEMIWGEAPRVRWKKPTPRKKTE